jgi:hypothetical protein
VEREKSAGDQTALQVHFLFVFQEISDDDFCQTNYGPSNLSSQLVEECNKNNISAMQHDPTMDSRDMATRALLVFLQNLQRSLYPLFSIFFFFFFLTGGLFQFYRHLFP